MNSILVDNLNSILVDKLNFDKMHNMINFSLYMAAEYVECYTE